MEKEKTKDIQLDSKNDSHKTKPFLTLMVGLPGSGKSTIARDYGKVVSTDQIRENLFGSQEKQYSDSIYRELQEKHPDWNGKILLQQAKNIGNNKVFYQVYKELVDGLKAGYDMVLDATNITRSDRKRAMKKTAGLARYQVVWVDRPIEKVLAQNASRNRVVDDEVIHRMQRRFQKPKESEGFDKVIRIE